ncbi:MAG: hypothetical protein PHP31_03470 [Lentimicrobiaceae bacterium]|jgi:beta-phosphoglucomutase-like phosphatase (HAD superfamily)|nr:hypothetical protein [Lentimicrobiaceae bacterium]
MPNNITILGVLIDSEKTSISEIQEIFTSYGCCVRTRLGLNQTDGKTATNKRLILLELEGDKEERLNLENALQESKGVEVKKMEFNL